MSEAIINSYKSLSDYKDFLDSQWEKHHYLRMNMKTGKIRTLTQNSALHLYCHQLADAFNSAGLDMVHVLSKGVSIPWSEEKVKSDIWKKVQLAKTGKNSTAKLTKEEVSQVYEIINRHIGERFGLFLPFPSKDEV